MCFSRGIGSLLSRRVFISHSPILFLESGESPCLCLCLDELPMFMSKPRKLEVSYRVIKTPVAPTDQRYGSVSFQSTLIIIN